MGQFASITPKLNKVSVYEIADQYGRIETDIVIFVFDTYFRLGCISVDSRVINLIDSILLIDGAHSSIYQIRKDSSAVVVDSEDSTLQMNSNDCFLYDDSGIVILSGKLARFINFTMILEYILEYDFSDIKNGNVKLVMGSSQIVDKAISDLDTSIGIDIVPSAFLSQPLAEKDRIYNLTE